MKTLLITALASVFALQVQGQYVEQNVRVLNKVNDFPWETSDQPQSINSGYGAADLFLVNRLNSMPVIDSMSFPDESYPYQSYCLYFEYNSNGRITKINIGANRSRLNENIVFVYEGGSVISIIHYLFDVPRETAVFEYDDAGILISQKSSDVYSNTDLILFNPDGTIKQVTYYKGMLTAAARTSTAYLSYDIQGRIKSFVHEEQKGMNYFGDSESLGEFNVLYSNTIITYEYTEPTESYPFLVQEVNIFSKDSIRFIRNNNSIDSCGLTSIVVKNTFNGSKLIESNPISISYYNHVFLKQGTMTYKADSVDGLVTKRYTVDQETKEEQLIASYVYENRNLIQVKSYYWLMNIFYAPEPKAESVQIKDNQVVTLEFNTVLDPEIDYATLLTLNSTQLKTETLSISKAYISAGNAKQLVIELNRPIATGENFEIVAIAELPLQDGRTVSLSGLKVDTATSDTEAAVSPLEITQTANGISISSGSEIVNVRIFTAIGVLVFSAYPQSLDFSISPQDLPSGIYQISAVDAAGCTVSETVSF